MSFSTDVKNELCSVSASRTVAEAECYGMLFGCRSFSFDKIFFQTGKLIHVYGWIITGRSETFDFDAEYIDR